MPNQPENEPTTNRARASESGNLMNPPLLESDWPALIVEGLETAIFSLDHEWHFTYVNNWVTKLWDRPKETLLGKVIWEEFPTLHDTIFEKLYRQAIAEARPQRFEGFSPVSHAWYEVGAYPIPQGLIVHFQDITARKQLEQTVAESEYRYKILSEASFEGVLLHENGITLEANQSAAQLYGYNSPEELIGQSIIPHLTPSGLAEVQKHFAENSHEPFEVTLIRNDGTQLPVETRGKTLEYRGRTVRVVTGRDISERKQREQQLRESEERYRILSEASYEGLAIRINHGPLVEANDRLAAMFGYSVEELLGIPLDKLVAPEALPAMQERLVTNRTDPFETIGLRKDGSRFFYESRGEILEYKGLPCRVMAVRDLTAIKQAEENLRKTQAQLAQSQKMESIGRLAGGIAHDFNNILTAITGYSDLLLLKLKETDPAYKDLLEIEKAADRATTLTRQLLVFSRQQVLQPKRLNLNRVVTEMDKLLQRLIGEDIELAAQLEPELGEVLADPGQLEQVIMNLAVNARDAMPNGGKLAIETANVELDEEYRATGHPQLKTGSYVMLAVSDTGVGMDEATQQRIFEPFFTTKEVGKGTGLGLATVYGIVEQSGGHILVYSEPGLGTDFKIYLPRVTETASNSLPNPVERAGTITPTAREGTQAFTVLLVEDDSLVGDLIERVLSEAGHTILRANNGQKALELASNYPGKIDLALTDIVMPRMGGRELITHLKERWPTLKVLGMSGYTDRAIEHQGALSRCDAFLQKPFTPGALFSQIEKMLKDVLPPSPST